MPNLKNTDIAKPISNTQWRQHKQEIPSLNKMYKETFKVSATKHKHSTSRRIPYIFSLVPHNSSCKNFFIGSLQNLSTPDPFMLQRNQNKDELNVGIVPRYRRRVLKQLLIVRKIVLLTLAQITLSTYKTLFCYCSY